MRPVRIELEGFAAFRAPTVVDFTDADLFAFVGATGAGKSSVIDGMIFALYGSVPRYNSENLVHPVITQGKQEARVRLDFDLDGRRYRAVRVVRRTKTGATTKEARLECDDEVLASDARGLQHAVTELLGLDLGQFTKCVVLPQGAFAQLLHDTSSHRQDLLVKLLDFGLYEQVARAARSRVHDADGRLAVLDGQLHELGDATQEAIDGATARVAALQATFALLDAFETDLGDLATDAAAVAAERSVLDEDRRALSSVVVPAAVDEIGARAVVARQALADAATQEAAAHEAVQTAAATRATLGDASALRAQLDAHRRLAELRASADKGALLVAERSAQLDDARRALTDRERTATQATAEVDRARLGHAAADIARHLRAGDACPVCAGTVTELPAFDATVLEQAEQALASTTGLVRDIADEVHRLDAELASYRATLADRHDQIARTEREIGATAGTPDAATTDARTTGAGTTGAGKTGAGTTTIESLVGALAAIDVADAAVEEARGLDTAARAATAQARSQLDVAAAAETAARRDLGAARDRVARLRPPPTTDDLAQDWGALSTFCRERVAALDQRAGELDRRAVELEAARADRVRVMVAQARAVGVDVAGDRVRDGLVAAVAEASHRRDDLVARQERGAAMREERRVLADERGVVDLLVRELHPRRFEAWLLDEALASLVAGASERLEQLSSGRYAMALDAKRNFEVIDHANADERRLARTLSGGETFLASLALALALAERVSELSATGHRSLDAIFLDEGFGTLDPETLDVVASAIEELGASGRMVGLISHVRELADRVPIRFEVTRGAETSTVTRVET